MVQAPHLLKVVLSVGVGPSSSSHNTQLHFHPSRTTLSVPDPPLTVQCGSRMLPSAISVHIKSRTCCYSRFTDIKRYYRESPPFLEPETAVWLELEMTPQSIPFPPPKLFLPKPFPALAVAGMTGSKGYQQSLAGRMAIRSSWFSRLTKHKHWLAGGLDQQISFQIKSGSLGGCGGGCWRWSRIIRVQDAAAALVRPPRADADRFGIRCSVAVAVCKAA